MELCYQPVVQSKMSMVTGVEALIRWTHPERGPISPALFIPIAEEANMIWQLGGWVLRKACEDASRWPGDMRVAVNVSPIQFETEEHTSELQSLMRISYAVFCLQKKNKDQYQNQDT